MERLRDLAELARTSICPVSLVLDNHADVLPISERTQRVPHPVVRESCGAFARRDRARRTPEATL